MKPCAGLIDALRVVATDADYHGCNSCTYLRERARAALDAHKDCSCKEETG